MSDPSRKRPLDSEFGGSDGAASKRSNYGSVEVSVKILVPSGVAGSVIGKKGESISALQRDTGARLRISHTDDYYPGTNERVCMAVGSVDAVLQVHDFIMDRIREKPEKSRMEGGSDPSKSAMERARMSKIIVPNSTAGMVIGKRGTNVQQIKEDSGAFVQVSQKPADGSLMERCINVTGDPESIRVAMRMILDKVCEDPQSGSCPNISYRDLNHMAASANVTGSPFANNMRGPGPMRNGAGAAGLGAGMQQLNLSGPLASGLSGAILDAIRDALRQAGYEGLALDDIVAALSTLASYNLLNVGLNAQGVSLNLGSCLSGPQGPMNMGPGGGRPGLGQSHFDSFGQGGGHDSNVFGPLGTTTTTMAPDTMSSSGGGMYTSGRQMSGGYQGGGGGMGFKMDPDKVEKIEVEVPESVVGVILGRGGADIVHLQQETGTRIQISKKGVYAPGTQNRIVTITGPRRCARQAEMIIRTKVDNEESRRDQLGTNDRGDQ